MQCSRRSFKETPNHTIRRGLADLAPQVDEESFRVQGRALGLRADIDPDHLNQLNDELEADTLLTVTARLQQGDELPS